MHLFLVKMKIFLARLYTLYAGFCFVLTSIVFLLPQVLLANRQQSHQLALRINFYWARTWMILIFMPVKIHWEERINRKQQYIICANHFSFLDIPANYLLGITFKYIGKSSIARIPVFGYMFKKTHIMVNRESVRSRGESMLRAREALNNGFSMCFFPEGGIRASSPPQMVPFRSGAFQLACEFNYPILPVVLHCNHRIFPDDGRFLMFREKLEVSVGSPIYPKGTSDEDIQHLKDVTFQKIQSKLSK